MKNPRAMATLLPETTGQLDRVISEMKMHAKHAAEGAYPYDEADIQTLKHHAEDMVAMGQYVLNLVDPAPPLIEGVAEQEVADAENH